MAPHRVRTPSIPSDILAAAAADLADRERRQRAALEAFSKDERCREAARAFLHAAEALWVVAPPDLPAVQKELLGACEALEAAGRLPDWCRVDHDKTYDSFRHQGGRELSWPSYEWARRLFEVGCKGELPEALLAQTWDTESLRDAVRWLRVFVAGLSGEGAVLPGTGRQLVLPAPAPLQLDSDLPGERPDEQLPPEGDKFSEKDVPPAFREGGKPAGAVLTAPYLEDSSNWLLNGPYLTKHYGQGKELTTHIKVARAKAYLYTELLVLRDQKTANEGEARH